MQKLNRPLLNKIYLSCGGFKFLLQQGIFEADMKKNIKKYFYVLSATNIFKRYLFAIDTIFSIYTTMNVHMLC